MNEYIKITGACAHNLKNIDVMIPKNKLTVITGVSGSGKSSLAFDIIFEERENKHSHVWIIPRYAWMNEICDRIIKNIGTILDYAKKNFRTRDVYEQISQITKIVKKNFASKKYN